MGIQIAFVVFGMLCDLLLGIFFPQDYAQTHLLFVPQFTFLCILLLTQRKPLAQVILIALTIGIILDFNQSGYIFLNTLTYTVTIYLVYLWLTRVSESMFETLLLVIVAIFCKELMVYAYMLVFNITHLSFIHWFTYREFLTLIGHIPLSLGLIYLNRIRLNFESRIDLKRRSKESPLWIDSSVS
jgi:rod shape-determining protein MreD